MSPDYLDIVYFAIVPTVMIPLTLLGVALSVLATTIAGFFGIKLKAEGPKQLLEVLIKPRVLLSAVVLNLSIFGLVHGYNYLVNKSKPLFWVHYQNRDNPGSEDTYTDVPYSETVFTRSSPASSSVDNLQLLWTKQLGGGSFRGPTLSGNAAFVSSNDGYIYELELSSGALRRKFYVGMPVAPSVMVWRGHLYAGEGNHETHHARIYKFDLKTGELAGHFTSKGHTEAQPRLISFGGREFLVFPAGGDGVYAIDPDTMAVIWHQNHGHADGEVQSKDDLVFVGTGRDKDNLTGTKPYALAYHLETGEKLWQQELTASSWMNPVLFEDHVCFTTGEIYYPSDIGGLYCFHQRTGQPTITINHTKPLTGVPLAIDDRVFVADIEGRVCSFSLTEKAALWCKLLGKRSFSYSSVIYDVGSDTLVFAHRSDGIFVLAPDSGEVLAHWLPEDDLPWRTTLASVSIKDGFWLIADWHGTIRTLTPAAPISH